MLIPLIASGCAFLALILLWQVFGSGPRFRRGVRRAERRLDQGRWQEALDRLFPLRQKYEPTGAWKTRLDQAEAKGRRFAVAQSLRERKFDDALRHAEAAAKILGDPGVKERAEIQQGILGEVRRLFSAGDNRATQAMIEQAFAIQSPCQEASFWQALCFLREGQPDAARRALEAARGEAGASVIDPPLYLGALLLRQQQPRDALRQFTEANRIDANCPVVGVQLGSAIIACDGDASLAVRALQKALGPKGLLLWQEHPSKLWVEGFPENRSYIRKLAQAHPFVCPLWGKDLSALLRQGNLALAQGLYRQGQFAESAKLYQKLIQEAAPSWAILRGLGLSLARLEQYDEAFKHLRAAHELEEPKDRLTAGYLALCGAKGKPSRPEDKVQNILWAIRLLSRFNAPGDREWANILGILYAEARHLGLDIGGDDQLYLCEHLRSVHAIDAESARAYLHLAQTHPESLLPEHAWLFCRADVDHRNAAPGALAMYARTFADRESAEAFFKERGWDFADVEIALLEQAAENAPGRFPVFLGDDYAPRGEQTLLDRARRQEEAGQLSPAIATLAVLARLAPAKTAAIDRLAQLQHRTGNDELALPTLSAWQESHPHDPVPRVRRAIFLAQSGQLAQAQDLLQSALPLCDDQRRGDVGLLAAKLTLQPDGALRDSEALRIAEEFLVAAGSQSWMLALVRWIRSPQRDPASQADWAALANHLESQNSTDPRVHFAAALCRWAEQNRSATLADCAKLNGSLKLNPIQDAGLDLELEGMFLAGLASDDPAQASHLLRPVGNSASPSASLAQAHLGRLAFQQGKPAEASQWWQKLDVASRSAWGVQEPLGAIAFLDALEDLRAGKDAESAEKFRAAGKLGSRDRRLGGLLLRGLFQAGWKAHQAGDWNGAVQWLEQAVRVGCKEMAAFYLLALDCKKLNRLGDARSWLKKITEPDVNVHLQRGLLAYAEKDYPAAEQEFARSWELAPASYAAGWNLLLSRLAQGQRDQAGGLMPRLAGLIPSESEGRFLGLLQSLLQSQGPLGKEQQLALEAMSVDDEQRLIDLLGSLGSYEAVHPLFAELVRIRSHSQVALTAFYELALRQAKLLLDKGQYEAARTLLTPLAARGDRERLAPMTLVTLCNLLGACACLMQDYDPAHAWFRTASEHFQSAQTKNKGQLAGQVTPRGVFEGAWLEQNLALAREWQGRLDLAETHWGRYFDYLEYYFPKSNPPEHLPGLAFEGLSRLGELYSRKNLVGQALGFLQRAHKIKPTDNDILERMFHLYNQLKRPEDAKKVLRRLREVRPNDPQVELFELDVRELRDHEDLEKLIGDVRRVLAKHPGNLLVEDRAAAMIANLVPFMQRLTEQWNNQIAKVNDQMRRLPSYQINWTVVREVMSELEENFAQLRRTLVRSQSLAHGDDVRSELTRLVSVCDRKIEQCRSLGE